MAHVNFIVISRLYNLSLVLSNMLIIPLIIDDISVSRFSSWHKICPH